MGRTLHFSGQVLLLPLVTWAGHSASLSLAVNEESNSWLSMAPASGRYSALVAALFPVVEKSNLAPGPWGTGFRVSACAVGRGERVSHNAPHNSVHAYPALAGVPWPAYPGISLILPLPVQSVTASLVLLQASGFCWVC